jgi:hypothetical protein
VRCTSHMMPTCACTQHNTLPQSPAAVRSAPRVRAYDCDHTHTPPPPARAHTARLLCVERVRQSRARIGQPHSGARCVDARCASLSHVRKQHIHVLAHTHLRWLIWASHPWSQRQHRPPRRTACLRRRRTRAPCRLCWCAVCARVSYQTQKACVHHVITITTTSHAQQHSHTHTHILTVGCISLTPPLSLLSLLG